MPGCWFTGPSQACLAYRFVGFHPGMSYVFDVSAGSCSCLRMMLVPSVTEALRLILLNTSLFLTSVSLRFSMPRDPKLLASGFRNGM